MDSSSFPLLTRYDDWEGEIVLLAWAGFPSQGEYGYPDPNILSDGMIDLLVKASSNEQSAPAPEKIAACQYLLDHQEAMRDSILEAILANDVMTDYEHVDEIKTQICLSQIYVLNVAKDGIAYTGFQFSCTWEEEHGVGVMTHTGSVVEVGGAATAFDAEIVKQARHSGNQSSAGRIP